MFISESGSATSLKTGFCTSLQPIPNFYGVVVCGSVREPVCQVDCQRVLDAATQQTTPTTTTTAITWPSSPERHQKDVFSLILPATAL